MEKQIPDENIGACGEMTSIWNEELQESVKSLWMEGKSAGQIAEIHNLSRNTIIGKVKRMGLVRNPKVKKIKVKFDTRYPDIKAPYARNGGVSMADLSRKGCLFAVTPHNAKNHLFCNVDRLSGSEYCPEHNAVCKRVVND